MDDHEQFLSEALQKAVQVVATIEGKYQEAALPIILQNLIDSSSRLDSHQESQQATKEYGEEHSLPPTLSANEFFRRVNANTHPARFVTAAYYLLHTGKAEHFSYTDISEIYRKLRQPQPKNPTDVMNQCIKKAYIIDAPDASDKQKSWVITPDGEKFVEGLLHDSASTGNTVIR